MQQKVSKAADIDCNAECPVKRTADVIDGKWTTLVVRELLPGKKRYSEIQRGLPGISPKLLVTRLRHLESLGLVTRTVFPTVPPTTEYELTELGRKLEGVLKAMSDFGAQLKETNLEQASGPGSIDLD